MAKKLMLLTSFLLVLAVTANTWAEGFSEPVDLTLRIHDPAGCDQDPEDPDYDPDCQIYPFAPTAKDDWYQWMAFGDTGEPHDSRNVCDVNGSGMCFGIANAPFGSHMVFQMSAAPYEVGALCNTWLQHEDNGAGSPGGDTHLVLWGDGLLPGDYEVEIYHNRTDIGGDPCDPNYALMPRVFVQTYCTADVNARYGRHNIDNIDAPLMPDCNVVVPIANDVNVWVQSVTDDANLIPSVVEFTLTEAGASIHIICEAPPEGTACINAFIVKAPATPWAFSPSPGAGSENVCPDVELSWKSGTEANDVNGQDLYFSTDYNDVNDREPAAHIGLQTDPCYDPPGNLDWGQTYYWRVDTVNDPCTSPGTVWDFTVETGKAYDPSPPDGGWSIEDFLTSWTPSCLADRHDIYFGTDFNDVNDGTCLWEGGLGCWPDWSDPFFTFVGAIVPGQRYYWRIDEKDSNSVVTFPKGDIWTFQARGGAVMHYTFDGPNDTNLPIPIPDDLNNVSFGRTYGGGDGDATAKYGEPNPLVNPLGTSAHFDTGPTGGSGSGMALSRLTYGFDIIDLAGDGYTIEMWVNQDERTTNGTRGEFGGDDFAASLFRRFDRSYILAIGEDGALRYAHSGDGDDETIESKAGAIPLGEWVHVAAVYDGDGSDPCAEQKLYIGGELVDTGWAQSTNPYDDDDVSIAGAQRPAREGWPKTGNAFNGYIDELRVSDVALLPSQFLIRGDPNLAWLPRPSHGKTKVDIRTKLKWNPGDIADSHDIYLGTSESDVTDANSTVTLGVWIDNQEPNEYDPCGLELDTTYYWRIDEVNDSNRWKGNIWRFSTANFVALETCEQYSSPGNELYDTWDDNEENDSGAFVDLGSEAYESDQSMYYSYNNTINWGYGAYVSESSRLVDFNDWNSRGLKILTLHFYGDPANNTEELYVGVESSAGGDYSEARYGDEGNDNNDVNEAEWHEWLIPLSNFTEGGTDLNDVETIYVGFGDRTNTTTAGGGGYVYIDEIWLQLPLCVPGEGPLYDLNDDCIVGWGDIEVIAGEWLKTDVNCPAVAPPSGLIGHWALDGDANDSNGTNHGTAEGEYAWVAGKIGPNSIQFIDNNDGGRVLVPDDASLTPAAEVTVAAWVNPDEDHEESSRVVVKGGDDNETYMLQMPETNPSFLVRDPCGEGQGVDSNRDLERDEWTHIAGSFDGSTLRFYVNGHLTNSESSSFGSFAPQADANGLAIGNRSDANDKAFIGEIDDVRLYDVALSQCDVVYLASEGVGYAPLDSVANLHDGEPPGEKAVNIRDVALVLETWLVEKLWPE
jgi:hypothetical protein